MKPILAALTIFNIVCLSLSAQLLPAKSALQTDIANVIHDYPNGFRNISGEEIINNPQSTEFGCKTSIQEASNCRVIKYTSSLKEIYSWEAEMMRTGDFDEASKKFKSIYNSLQHLSVDVDGVKAIFKADYIKPTDAIKFTTIVFDTEDRTPEFKKLKVALLLESEMMEWIVKVQVYEKEREDDEKGRAKDQVYNINLH